MCGIVGAVAQRDVTPILLEGLKRLEYRGYDSAGIAVVNEKHHLQRVRAEGKVAQLVEKLHAHPITGTTGISHTRWATHGRPSEINAHPVYSQPIVVVHNGIIENQASLRATLEQEGYQFTSETDTEVVAHLIQQALQTENDLLRAVQIVVDKLEGAYALGIMNVDHPEHLIGVRRGCPLVVGIGIGEHFIASDHLALLPVTQSFIYLEEGDIVEITRDQIQCYNKNRQRVERPIHTINTKDESVERGEYRHFMQKEIFEQPAALRRCLSDRLHKEDLMHALVGTEIAEKIKSVGTIHITACGTSYHAGLIARYWIESLVGIPCHVEVASEYRYRNPVTPPNTLLLTISQSGETADTLAALRHAKAPILKLAICNSADSTLVRESDGAILTHAGREIGVASSKSFTTQLTALLLLTLALWEQRQTDLNKSLLDAIQNQLALLPDYIQSILMLDKVIHESAKNLLEKHNALFLGRGTHYPVALEGALKLKEISYIHAEAYPAGELKHGPLALVDSELPVIIIAPNDSLLEKLMSNIQEIRARGGELLVFTNTNQLKSDENMKIIDLPKFALTNDSTVNQIVNTLVSPILFTIPLQLLAYHVAVLRGTDVDQPRNLAKSVTVE